MRATLGIAIAVCVLTSLFLALVVRPPTPKKRVRRPQEAVQAQGGSKARARKPPPRAAVPTEKGVIEVKLVHRKAPLSAKANIEAVSATDPRTKFTANVSGGRFRFANLEAGEWIVSATSGALVAPTRVVLAGDKPAAVELVLVSAGRIRGSVAASDGSPIMSASVVCRERINDRTTGAPREAATDRDGHFELAAVAPGRYELVASSRAMEPARREAQVQEGKATEGPETTFRLESVKWGTIRGTVLDAEGRPVAGASIRVSPEECRIAKRPGADGAFEIEAPPGKVVLAADAPGFVMAVRDDVVVLKGGEEQVDLRLGVGKATIAGRVLLGSGEPAVGTLVECLLPSGEPGQASAGVVASTRTDAKGAFALRGFVEGTEYQVRVSVEGQPLVEAGVVRTPAEECEVVVGEVRFAILGGRVVTPAPSGVEAPEVRTEPLRYELKVWRLAEGGRRLVGVFVPGTPSSTRDPQFEAGDAGAFVLRRMMPGTYALVAMAEGYAPTEVGPVSLPAEAQLTDLAIRLGKGRTVAGRVIGRGSQAGIAGAKVRVLDAAGQEVAPVAETDRDGSFALRNLGAGRYTVVVTHEDFREMRAPVDVSPDTNPRALKLALDDSPALAGSVVDAEGKPVDVGQVVAMREGERREGAVKDGKYEVRGLSGGLYRVWAFSPGKGQAMLAVVSVSADGITLRDLRLSPGGTLRITLLAGGAPVVGAKVSLNWKDGTEVATLSRLDGAGQPAEATDPNGVILLTNVPAEPLVLRIAKGGTTRELDVCVPEGATLALPVGWAR